MAKNTILNLLEKKKYKELKEKMSAYNPAKFGGSCRTTSRTG